MDLTDKGEVATQPKRKYMYLCALKNNTYNQTQ